MRIMFVFWRIKFRKIRKKLFNFRKLIIFRTMKKYENAKKYFREKKKLIYDDRTLGMKSIDLRRCHKLLPFLSPLEQATKKDPFDKVTNMSGGFWEHAMLFLMFCFNSTYDHHIVHKFPGSIFSSILSNHLHNLYMLPWYAAHHHSNHVDFCMHRF